MQHIHIVCVGKLKERWLREGCAEYSKRLTGSIQLSIHEVVDEPTPERLSAKEVQQLLQREGEKICKAVPTGSHVIALTLEGRTYKSAGFSRKLGELALNGVSRLCFIIGGSLGLGENVLQIAHEQLCLSEMTLPHQLCRVVLLEQLYRAYGIMAGTAYHK